MPGLSPGMTAAGGTDRGCGPSDTPVIALPDIATDAPVMAALFRPSTSCHVETERDVDARAKPGHDGGDSAGGHHG
jgi:hypothetical protein